MTPETTKQLAQSILDATNAAREEGRRVGYREGWAACAEMLRRERDALGRRLDSAGSGVCEEARAAE
jgi:hypothetical protein